MKYSVTTVQQVNGETACSAFVLDKKEEAMARFHSEMVYAYTAKITTTCSVVDTKGKLIASEDYTAPAPAPEPEPDAEGGEGT